MRGPAEAQAKLGPVAGAYAGAVSWRSINYHTHISLVNRYVYVEVPKAGCGTMKATLGGLEASRLSGQVVERFQAAPHDRTKATPFVRPYQLSPGQLEEVLASPEFKRFTVVREPAQRLLSGYLEKIRQGLKQSEPIMAALGADAPASAADITLEQFLQVVCAQESRDQDPHFRRQADHLGMGIVQYDAIIDLADLDASWTLIGELTGNPDIAEQRYCRNETKAATRMQDYYTPALLDLVESGYADDYRLLGLARPQL